MKISAPGLRVLAKKWRQESVKWNFCAQNPDVHEKTQAIWSALSNLYERLAEELEKELEASS